MNDEQYQKLILDLVAVTFDNLVKVINKLEGAPKAALLNTYQSIIDISQYQLKELINK
jgi:hypothetical protein